MIQAGQAQERDTAGAVTIVQEPATVPVDLPVLAKGLSARISILEPIDGNAPTALEIYDEVGRFLHSWAYVGDLESALREGTDWILRRAEYHWEDGESS